MLENEGRYAIIALPCVVKSLRLAMERSRKLRERATFLLGLTCGQGKSAFFAEYVCAMGGGDPRHLAEVSFRVKDCNRPASDYGLRFVTDGGAGLKLEGVVHQSEGVGRTWSERYFTPSACDFCDDVFAELADVSFMDAWLPDHVNDWRGCSIVLTRDDRIDAILSEYIDAHEVDLTPIRIEDVVKSQAGQILEKRVAIHERMRLLRKSGLTTGYTPRGSRGGMLHRLETRLKYEVSRTSARAWLDCEKDIHKFRKTMQPVTRRLSIVRQFRKRVRAFLRRLHQQENRGSS